MLSFHCCRNASSEQDANNINCLQYIIAKDSSFNISLQTATQRP